MKPVFDAAILLHPGRVAAGIEEKRLTTTGMLVVPVVVRYQGNRMNAINPPQRHRGAEIAQRKAIMGSIFLHF